jgi:hypothetical protein
MKAIGWASLFAACLLLEGCSSGIQTIPSTYSFVGSERNALVVLRVHPRALICIAKGRVDRYGWRAKTGYQQFWAEDGVFVLEMDETQNDEAYGITSIKPDKLVRFDEGARSGSRVLWPRTRRYVAGAIAAGAIGVAAASVEPPTYIPKAHVRLPVFDAVAGRVTDLGTIEIDAPGPESSWPPEQIGVRPITKPDARAAVVKYLARHYPDVNAEVISGSVQLLPRNEHTDFE